MLSATTATTTTSTTTISQQRHYHDWTNIEDLRKELNKVIQDEKEIDQELDTLILRRNEFEQFHKIIEFIRPKIESTASFSKKVALTICDTSQVAERMSRQVRELDASQSRVRICLQYVEAIQDLKICAKGLSNAISSHDLTSGAALVKRFRAHDLKKLETVFSLTSTSTSNSSQNESSEAYNRQNTTKDKGEIMADLKQLFKSLKDNKSRLIQMVVDDFDMATQAGKETNIRTLLKLFPLLGEEILGLDKFSAFLCGTLARYCQDFMKQVDMNTDPAKVVYGDVLSRLFDMVASVISRQEETIEKDYGPGRMLRLIQRLQRECDIQACIMLDAFLEKKKVPRKIHDIKSTELKSNLKVDPYSIDLRELDLILNEMALICHKTLYFERFMHVKAKNEIKNLKDPELLKTIKSLFLQSEDGLAPHSNIFKRVQEMMNDFAQLEEFYIKMSMNKAIKIDHQQSGMLTSTCVDDIFFVLKKASVRIISTADVQGLCSIINMMGRLLEFEFVQVLQKKLSVYFASGDGGKESKIDYLILLNNIDLTCRHIEKLSQEIQRDIDETDRGLLSTDSAKQMIQATMTLMNDYRNTFNSLLKEWIEKVFSQLVKPKLKKILQDGFKDLKYTLTEAEYASQSEKQTFTRIIMSQTNRLLGNYKKSFTTNNLFGLLQFTTDMIVKELEKHIVQNIRFTLYGSLQLDKDIRTLTQYLIDMSPPEQVLQIKDKLVRLNHISALLSVEEMDEVQDIWESEIQSGFSLSVALVKKILLLRVDIKPEDVRNLEFGGGNASTQH